MLNGFVLFFIFSVIKNTRWVVLHLGNNLRQELVEILQSPTVDIYDTARNEVSFFNIYASMTGQSTFTNTCESTNSHEALLMLAFRVIKEEIYHLLSLVLIPN